MERLEQETSLAQQTHVADVRSLADRLLARHNAHEVLLLAELERAELDGNLSIRGLEARMGTVEATRANELQDRDVELGRRQARLDALAAALEEEQQWRRFESRNAGTELRTLTAEVARLEQALDTALRAHAADKHMLGVQLATQSAAAGSSSQSLHQQLREGQVTDCH